MAKIVVGIASSHTPQLSMGAEMWPVHSSLVDHRLVDLEAQRALAPLGIGKEVTSERIAQKDAECQSHIAALSEVLRQARPDVVIIFGDDHREVFQEELSPALAIYCGDEVWDLPSDLPSMIESQRVSDWAYHGDVALSYPTAGGMGSHIAREITAAGFDPAVMASLPQGISLGHAFTFVKRRLGENFEWTMLPIWLNAFYGPNKLSARRCFDIGQAVRAAVESWPGDERVAIVASGGLSHYLVDEEFDRKLLNSLQADDAAALCAIPDEKLESGSGEIRMWISAAGALRGMNVSSVEYVPGYRSDAATGVGLGFAVWQ